MRIAIPIEDGRLAEHFGRAGRFQLFEVDAEQRVVLSVEEHDAPRHEPGRLPAWLTQLGVDMVIAGGMGPRAAGLLEAHSIGVICGVPPADPRALVEQYLEGVLAEGRNRCTHGRHGGGGCLH